MTADNYTTIRTEIVHRHSGGASVKEIASWAARQDPLFDLARVRAIVAQSYVPEPALTKWGHAF